MILQTPHCKTAQNAIKITICKKNVKNILNAK